MFALKWLKNGNKITRDNKNFQQDIDYIQLGLEDEYNPVEIECFKDDKWLRNTRLWIDDYEANDWIIYKKGERVKNEKIKT